MGDEPGAYFVAKQAIEYVLIDRKRALGENRIAELLEFLHDLVVQTRVMVIYAAEHDNTNPVFTLQLVERLPRLAANLCLAIKQGFEAGFDGPLILLAREPQHRPPRFEHLVGADPLILQVQDRIDIADTVLSEDVALLGEGSLYYLRSSGDSRARIRSGQVHQGGMQPVVHREPDSV